MVHARGRGAGIGQWLRFLGYTVASKTLGKSARGRCTSSRNWGHLGGTLVLGQKNSWWAGSRTMLALKPSPGKEWKSLKYVRGNGLWFVDVIWQKISPINSNFTPMLCAS